MTRFLLIRHGESTHNKARVYTGQIDAPLSPLGEREARAVCRFVLENYSIDAVYASDLQRAMNTVRGIAEAKGFPLHTDPALREMDIGLWGGKTFETVNAEFTESHRLFCENIWENNPDGGENYGILCDRASDALRRIAEAHPRQTVVVGTHGGVIRALLSHWKYGREQVNQVPILPNGSVTEMICDNNQFYFDKIGLTEHTTAEPAILH